jgi:hypothetical protein
MPKLASYHIAFTTPYLLMAGKEDWLRFFRRATPSSSVGTESEALHWLLKYGPAPGYWNEYVFKAYHHHQSDAIFLTGIPDLNATLPYA